MASQELRGLAFQTHTGETVRVHDCICWRHLEGRPCRTTSDRHIAEATDVVIIPVIPAGQGGSKRARKGSCTGGGPCLSDPNPSIANTGTNGSHSTTKANPDRDALLTACSAAQVALTASGLRATVDTCPKQTPGAKYNAWENRGVPLRVEVGAREVVAGTFCLALHPRLAHLLPTAVHAGAAASVQTDGAQAARSTDAGVLPPAGGDGGASGHGDFQGQADAGAVKIIAGPAAAGSSGAASSTTQRGAPAASSTSSSTAARGGAKQNLRIPDLSLDALVAACGAVLQAAAPTSGGGANTAAADGPAGPARALSHLSPAAPVQNWWCRKLHLWPEAVAARGSTEAAVAALLEALSSSALSAVTRTSSPGGGGWPPGASGSGPIAASAAGSSWNPQPQEQGRNGDSQPELASGQGLPSPLVSTALAAASPQPQRPCVAHLRHLLQLGRPCHCGRGHCSLQQLQQEVERCHVAATGQGVSAWVLPAAPAPAAAAAAQQQQPAAGSRRGQQPQHQQRRARQPPAAVGPELAGVREMEEDEEVEEGAGGGGSGRVVLLAGNIPPDIRAAAVQGELAAAFAPYGCCGVGLSRTRNGGSHGWARVTLEGSDAAASAAAAVKELDGKLRLGGGNTLSVSHSCGRLDTIFPYLPYAVRSAMRVDSTAAYSATDQATADKMTDLLAALAERFLLLPHQSCGTSSSRSLVALAPASAPVIPPTSAPASAVSAPAAFTRGLQASGSTPATEAQAAAAVAATAVGVRSPPAPPPLLPLTVTDGTACCGGNALSFARRFRRVVAVELDEDRAEDLRHNAALVRAWAEFQHHQAQQEQQAPRPGQQQLEETARVGAHGGAARSTGSAADGVGDDLGMGLGRVEVLCGDYTALAAQLRQDIVFMDPPWGGPQYSGSAPKPPAVAAVAGASCVAGGGGGEETLTMKVKPAGQGGGSELEYGDAVFMLGATPMSYLVSELLAGNESAGRTCTGAGYCRMVAVKLPSRADVEMRAMQARVRQLVMARLFTGDGPTGPSGGGGGSDGGGERNGSHGAAVAGADRGESGGGRCFQEADPARGPRLLGAEITLGRSALVVFLLVPVAGEMSGRVAGRPMGQSFARSAVPHAAIEGEDCEGDAEGGVDGPCGLQSGQVSGRTAGARTGSSFRAALREVCTRLGLSYRVVCE